MQCNYCGNAIPDDSLVCGYCGHAVKDAGNRADETAPVSDETSEGAVPQARTDDADPMVDIAAHSQLADDGAAGSASITDDKEEVPADEPRGYTVERPMYQQMPLTVDTGEVPHADAEEDAVPVVMDKQLHPLSTAAFFWTQVVLLIPVINIILLLLWAFRERSNVNRRAYARSILIWAVIVLIAALAGVITMLFLQIPVDINYWIEQLKSAVNSIPRL